MEASNPHLRLPSISSAYSGNSGFNQSNLVYSKSQNQPRQEQFNQNVPVSSFVNPPLRQIQVVQQGSKLGDHTVEQNSHGDHQRVSTLTKMNNCMTNSTPLNPASSDSSSNFSHSTNVNHSSQLENNIQYQHGTHDTNLTSVQYNPQQQQAKEQNSREGQYAEDTRQYSRVQRIDQLQQIEQQQQQLHYQRLVQQQSLSQQQQLISNQNQIPQQLLLQQGENFPLSLNPAQQQYLLQQRYQQQQQHQQQQANLQQQVVYQQQQNQQRYLASQGTSESVNQQALLHQQLAYQQHLLSQQESTNNGPQFIKQESLEAQQRQLLQQISLQQENIKSELKSHQEKQNSNESIGQYQSSITQQSGYQQPKSNEQGNQNHHEPFGKQSVQSVLPHQVPYQQQLLVKQNLKPESSNSTAQIQRNQESNESLNSNQNVQPHIANQGNGFKSDQFSQLNKEIAVQNQLILQQQLAYQQLLLQQQNSSKRQPINPVFLQNTSHSSKRESSEAIAPQQSFLNFQQQLIAQQQNSYKPESTNETHSQKQESQHLKQENSDTVSSINQNLLQQQIGYQQQILQQQQTTVKLEPNDSQRFLKQESIEHSLNQQLFLQQASFLKPESVGKQESLASVPIQQTTRFQQEQVLPQQIPQLLQGHLPQQFPQSVLSVPRDIQQILPSQQLLPSSDSQNASHLLPGHLVQVLSNGQKIITTAPRVVASQSVLAPSESSKLERSVESDSSGLSNTPLSSIRVVPYGKVVKESSAPTVKSETSEPVSGKPFIRVPLQWKRLIANGMVIYVSPSNTALSSMDQLKAYLQTPGTCKCGLECPLQCDSVFSFDAKVASKPWSPIDFQDSSSVGEFNKLCNHKRKHMTMMGFDPDNPLDGKRLDGPDFRKKRKVYAGPYSNATGPRKPRLPKDSNSPAPALATPWTDSSPQQPPPVQSTQLTSVPAPSSTATEINPSVIPPIPPQPSGPRMFNPRMAMPPQQPFMQGQLDQQRIFRYQHPSQANMQRIYQGTPPMDQMYAANNFSKAPEQEEEESQSVQKNIPTAQNQQNIQGLAQNLQGQMTQNQVEMEQQMEAGQSQMQQQNQMQQQSQQMQMSQFAQMQAMQQAHMQAVQAQLANQMQQQQQAVQNQQMHIQGIPTPQQQHQQMTSDQTSNNPLQTQQSLSQQQMSSGPLSQLQVQRLSQQSNQQQQMQMQMQAQLAQMQQMQQQYERQDQPQSSHHPTDQYQTESNNPIPNQPSHYARFHGPVQGQGNNAQDPKLSLIPQHQYRQASYPLRAPHEPCPPQLTPNNYPTEGNFEPNCDISYQNNNQSASTNAASGSNSIGLQANAYHVSQPQPVFNYQRQTPEQILSTNVQAVQPTQRPTPPWQQSSRPTTPSNPTPPSPYERVPPLHPSNVQNTIGPVVFNQMQSEATIPMNKKRTKTATKSPNKKLTTDSSRQESNLTYPSFMDDPSGYLAQQTALLNSTISKQCDIRVSGDMLENKNLQRIARRLNSTEGTSLARTADSSVRNETSDTPIERNKTPLTELKGPIQGGTISTSNRSPGGILVPVEASSPRSISSMNSNNSPQPYSTPSSPGPKSPERHARSMPLASGHTVSSNTLTSVLAGRSNTSLTASVTSPPQPEVHIPATLPSKSPLEMVQSVVSSIQLPQVPQQTKSPSVSLADIKVSSSLPGHILVSSNGQLIVASQPQTFKSNPSLVTMNTSSASSSSSSLVTNVTGAISQVIPSLGMNQQVLGQPTVLVNTLQAPLLFQPNIMTMDNINTVQIPQLTVSSPVGSDSSGAYSPRSQGMISPESSKRKALKANKNRKGSPQKVTSMILTPQQGNSAGTSTVVMQPQQNFAQPMLQTLILPNKGNFNNQLITTALQPLNVLQQFPTIQQFLVPAGLGGMAVMSQDGTATLLQDTVQLNVLTPMQASGVFGGHSILPNSNSVVIRAPNTSGTGRPNGNPAQGQFITTNSQNQLIINNPFANQLQSQLSPIITNLSPNNQQISFASPTSQRQTQEYIQCGQTLIPITSQQSNNVSQASSNQNASMLQQNTLLQQQMSLLQQANSEQTGQNFVINETGGNKTPNIIINDGGNKTQNFIITTSEKQPGSTNYILSPKSDAKSPGGQTHFILNTSDSKSSGQSFIITSPTDSKQILTSGNIILTSDKTNSGNLILSTASQQHIQQQEKAKFLQQQQIQQITQQQLQQLQLSSQQLQQLQQSSQQLQLQQTTQQLHQNSQPLQQIQLSTQQIQQLQQSSQQLQQLQQANQQLQQQSQHLQQNQQTQQIQIQVQQSQDIQQNQQPQSMQTQQIQLQNHRLNMSTQTSVNPASSANQMIQASPITIYVSQSQSSTTNNLYTTTSNLPLGQQSNTFTSSSGSGGYQSNSPATSVYTVSSTGPTSSVYTISSTAPSSVYTSSPPDTTTLSPVEAGGVPSPCHSLEVPPSPLLGDDNHPSPTSTSVHLVSSSNTDWSDGNPDIEGFATPKATSSRPPSTPNASFVKSSSKDFVESSSSPPTHRSYSRHHHSHHHHRPHGHHHHPSSSKNHHSKSNTEYTSHRSDSSSSRHHSHHVTNVQPDEGTDSDHSNDSDDSNSALTATTKLFGLSEGDLVWGQVKGYPSWPGKLISPAPTQGRVWVKWFGMSNEPLSEVEPATLKSLSQGLEAHHRSRKKLRKSRKLNTQLENAIHEAMAELDRMSETPQQSRPLPPAVAASVKSKR